MPITKTIITVTILHPSDDALDGLSLHRLGYEIDEGAWLGQSVVTSSEVIRDAAVSSECAALGNDGSFFDNES